MATRSSTLHGRPCLPRRDGRPVLRLIACAASVLLTLASLAGCAGGIPSPTSSTPTAAQSQRDAYALAYMVDVASQLTEAAGEAQHFLVGLNDGSWASLPAGQQLATLTKLESISQTITRELSTGSLPANAVDLRTAQDGVFLRAVKAGHEYISSATDASSSLAYLEKAQVVRETPKWVARIVAMADGYAAARKALDGVLAQLKSKYGS